MAIVLPIVTQYSGRGLQSAISEVGRAQGAFGKLGAASTLLGGAMAGAAIAAGALALKLGAEGVQAAMEDEQAAAKLAKTLDNLGLAADSVNVERFVSGLEKTYGIADTKTRPALDRLVRSIGNTGEAQQALNLALDVSAGTGRTLEQTVQAIGRAYDGNTQGLSRLGAGLDQSILKTGDMKVITAELSKVFGGQAKVQAETLQGSLNRVSLAADNLKEAFGRGVIDALAGTASTADDVVNSLAELEPALEGLGQEAGKGILNATKNLSILAAMAKALRNGDFAKLNEIGFAQADMAVKLSASYLKATSVMDRMKDTAGLLASQAGGTTQSVTLLGDAGYAAGAGLDDGAAGADTMARALAQLQSTAAATASALASAYGGTLSSLLNTSGASPEFWKRLQNLDTGAAPPATVVNTTRRAGGAAGALADNLTKAEKAAKKAGEQFDAMQPKVERTITRLQNLAKAVEDAKQKLVDYAQEKSNWITGSLDLGAAVQQQIDYAAQAADLDAKIAAAIAKGDSEGKAKLEAEKAGMGAAVAWSDAFLAQIAQAKGAAQAVDELLKNLNPADSLGNQRLLDALTALPPEQAQLAASDLVKNGLGPQIAAELSSLDVWANGTALTWAQTFYQPGVDAAQTSYDAIKTTLEKRLPDLYALGRKAGKSFMDGYNSMVNGLPKDVRLPNAPQLLGSSSNGQAPIVVNVTAGIGNPVAIAQEVQRVLAASSARLGV